MALLLAVDAPLPALHAAAGLSDAPPPLVIDVACRGFAYTVGELYYSEILELATPLGDCRMDMRPRGAAARTLAPPEIAHPSVGTFTCSRNTIIVGHTKPRTEYNVALLGSCRSTCMASLGCVAFVHNKYAECHLFEGDPRSLGTSTDQPIHETVGCLSSQVAFVPVQGATTPASRVAVDALVEAAERFSAKLTLIRPPPPPPPNPPPPPAPELVQEFSMMDGIDYSRSACFINAADHFHSGYATLLDNLGLRQCAIEADGKVSGALWLVLIGDLSAPAPSVLLGDAAASRIAASGVLTNGIDELATLNSRGGTAALLHALLGELAWKLTPRTATITLGNGMETERFGVVDQLAASSLWPLTPSTLYVIKTPFEASGRGLALWSSQSTAFLAAFEPRVIAKRLVRAVPRLMQCTFVGREGAGSVGGPSSACPEALVIQKLVPEPLTVHGRKLNARSLLLILPGANGRRTRLYHDYGQWMVATHALTEDSTDKASAQIVNTAGKVSQQIDSSGFIEPPAPGAAHRSLQRLARHLLRDPTALSDTGWTRLAAIEPAINASLVRRTSTLALPPDDAQAQAVEIALKGLMAKTTASLLSALCPLVTGARRGQFALLGADFLLDRHAQLWLIELNPFPVMPLGTHKRDAMFQDKMRDILRLLRAWSAGRPMPVPRTSSPIDSTTNGASDAIDKSTLLLEMVESGEPPEPLQCMRTASPGETRASPISSSEDAPQPMAALAVERSLQHAHAPSEKSDQRGQDDWRASWPVASTCRKPTEQRVAIGFYGTSRSLHSALPSLHGRVLWPLATACVEVDTYVHVNLNRRDEAAQTRSVIENALRPVRYAASLQHRLTSSSALLKVAEQTRNKEENRCLWIRNYSRGALANLVHALHSLSALSDLLESRAHRYTAVLVTRMDLAYVNSIDVTAMLGVVPREIHVPVWHSFEGTNDRLAFGAPGTMLAFGRRLRHVREYVSTGRRLNAEEFLRWVLVEKEGLHLRNNSLIAQRMRQDHRADAKADSLRQSSRFATALGGSALAHVFWFDRCLTTSCNTSPDGCRWDCSAAGFDKWRGWEACDFKAVSKVQGEQDREVAHNEAKSVDDAEDLRKEIARLKKRLQRVGNRRDDSDD